MSDANAILIVLGLGACWFVLATLPRWFTTDLNRDTLWRLHDELVDARRTGFLPDSIVTDNLVADIEDSIAMLPYLSPFTRWRLDRAVRRMPGGTQRRIAAPRDVEPPADWSDEQRSLAIRARAELSYLLNRQMFLGSWAGLAFVLGLLVWSRMSKVVELRHAQRGGPAPNPTPQHGRLKLRLWPFVVDMPADSLPGQIVGRPRGTVGWLRKHARAA